mgnify:FL=1
MLSSNNSFRLAKMALALAAALLVSACFRPLYGPTASGQSARAVLGSIDVKPIPDIAGHYLREELLFLFTGGAESVSSDAAYTLTVKLAESSQAVALDSTGGRADAASFTITATYTLQI